MRKSLPANAGGDPLEQKMATHSTILAWKIPWTEEPGGLPTPLFLPGKFHGQRSMVDYSPWGRKGSDTTKRLSTHMLWQTVSFTFFSVYCWYMETQLVFYVACRTSVLDKLIC